MEKFIVQMRRGTQAQWLASDVVPRAGEIVVEIDEDNSLHKLKIGDGETEYSDLAYLMAGDEIVSQVLPRVITVTLNVNAWTSEVCATDSELTYYKQTLAVSNISENSRLDLQPDADMLAEFQRLNLTFTTENKNGVITVYSFGDLPTKSYTMQASIVNTEVQSDADYVIATNYNENAIYYVNNNGDKTRADPQPTSSNFSQGTYYVPKVMGNTVGTPAPSYEDSLALTKKKLEYLTKLTKGQVWDTETDSDADYIKSVPDGAKCVSIEKIGGKTIVWNQLVNKNDFPSTQTKYGVTFTNNGDGTITANGTATADIVYTLISLVDSDRSEHKIAMCGCPSGGSNSSYKLVESWNGPSDVGNGVISRVSVSGKIRVDIKIINGTTVSNLVFTPQYFDLTNMFGSGNEPSTFAEFKTMFPAGYYDYNAGTLISMPCTKVVSEGRNKIDLWNVIGSKQGVSRNDNGVISYLYAENLSGVIWTNTENYTGQITVSAKFADNDSSSSTLYVKFTYTDGTSVSHSRSGSGGINNWFTYVVTSDSSKVVASISLRDAASPYDGKVKDFQIEFGSTASTYTPYMASEEFSISQELRNYIVPLGYGQSYGSTYNYIDFEEKKYYKFGSYVNGVWTASVSVIDISDYLTDDNLLSVSDDSTLTFVNSNGGNYKVAIPSTVEYAINLYDAT